MTKEQIIKEINSPSGPSLDLPYYRINLNFCVNIAEVLKSHPTLTTIFSCYSNMGYKGAAAIADALKSYTTLTTLDLSDKSIGREGVAAIADALKSNTTLTTLRLSSNIDHEGAAAIADALKSNTTLTTLDLYYNNIGCEGAASIADVLKSNTTLTTLNLSYNNIGSEEATAIADALKSNNTLTNLDLSQNNIGSEGAAAIADVLKSNTTLTTLNLSYNNIGSEEATAIADALRSNTTLTTLDLYYNNIGCEGAAAIADALQSNTTLTKLDLYHNNIGRAGAAAIADALRSNTTLTTLTLSQNNIGRAGAAAIADALKENSTCLDISCEYERSLIKRSEVVNLALEVFYQGRKINYILKNRAPVDITSHILSFLYPAPHLNNILSERAQMRLVHASANKVGVDPVHIQRVNLLKKLAERVSKIEKLQINSMLEIFRKIREILNSSDKRFQNIARYPDKNRDITAQICKLAKEVMIPAIKQHKFTNKMVMAIATELKTQLTKPSLRAEIDRSLEGSPLHLRLFPKNVEESQSKAIALLMFKIKNLILNIIEAEIRNKKALSERPPTPTEEGLEESKGEDISTQSPRMSFTVQYARADSPVPAQGRAV